MRRNVNSAEAADLPLPVPFTKTMKLTIPTEVEMHIATMPTLNGREVTKPPEEFTRR